jgi:ketosteroid isomerase-like protein
MNTAAEKEALVAIDELIDAFGGDRVEEYFERLAPDATFVFHTAPGGRLGSRDDYRALWRRWNEDDGFRVVACTSSNRRVLMLGPDAAVVAHDVATEVETNAGREQLSEQETIVLERRNGVWLVVHEHLSPRPS